MKYMSAENNTIGIKGVPQSFANTLMEGLGVALPEDTNAPALYENNGSVFCLGETVYEHEDFMFLKLGELSDSHFSNLQESNANIPDTVNFNDVAYGVSDDIYEIEGDYYVGLTESVEIEEEEADDDAILTVEGIDYLVVENDEDADFIAYLSEDSDGDLTVVDEEDNYTHSMYVQEL
tara:strand:+ start:561 stop:1094 length:534 start_codon:yes stop_codon:yes gene_type:complete